MYTYLIKSKNLKENDIKKVFNQRGNWKEYNEDDYEKGYNPDFLYVDNIYASFDKTLYKYNIQFKNITDRNSKMAITDKKQLYDNLLRLNDINIKKYLIPQNIIKMEHFNNKRDNINNYKKYFENNNVAIIKIISGASGQHLYIFQKFNEFVSFCDDIIKKYKYTWNNPKYKNMRMKNLYTANEWVMQKYITNPLLFNGKKFHIRTYFFYYRYQDPISKNIIKKGYLYKLGNIWTARNKYVQGDYYNLSIHDSRGRNTEQAYFFPDDFSTYYGTDNAIKIFNDILQIHSYILHILNSECYPESKNCYEVFGGDIMITNDMKVKLIELNGNFGYLTLKGDDKEHMYNILNESMINSVDKILKPKNTPASNNMFVEVQEYKPNKRSKKNNPLTKPNKNETKSNKKINKNIN